MSRLIPGLQYPGEIDESTSLGAAIRSIFDNLFYLRGLAEDVPNLVNQPRFADSIKTVVKQVISTAPTTPVTGSQAAIVGTHLERVTIYGAVDVPPGTMFYETDRTVTYIASNISGTNQWVYDAGVMSATLAGYPADLGTNDSGFLLIVTDYKHWCKWSGSVWSIVDDPPGVFVESSVALTTGYALCNGVATTLLSAGATLVSTAFTPSDENGAPSGVYHKSIAAYTGTIDGAVAPTLSGSTSVDTTGITTGQDNFSQTADLALALSPSLSDPGHSHGVGSLAVSTTGQPRSMGVLRYVRR